MLELPCVFIDDYFTDCLPVYPLIYIWSLRRLLDGHSASLQEIGERFQLTEGDVKKAWQHWENVKLVSVSYANDEMEITFLPMSPRNSQPLTLLALPEVKEKTSSRPKKQIYSPPELECYSSESPDVKRLFKCAEKTLDMPDHKDLNTIFYFYDGLRLPIDVIEYLLEYCAENDNRSLRYIEKCAIDWANNGIDSIEKAAQHVQNFDHNYREILNYLGKSPEISTARREYMNRWLHEWNMPLNLIEKACEKATLSDKKNHFRYVNTTLSGWRDKGITTLEEVAAADEEFLKENQKTTTRASSAKPKPNRFVNYEQPEYDYEKIEKMERAYNDKLLRMASV
jgi:DnaD/phage-associated family protein